MPGTLSPAPINEPPGSFAWAQWYQELVQLYSATGAIPWASIDTAGSNITDIATRTHANLQSLQGGTAGEYYHLTANQSNGTGVPRGIRTETGDYVVAATDHTIICNKGSTLTLTLPAASSSTGRQLMVVTIQAFTVVSASSNVIPLVGGAAGSAILPARDGAWATLQSNGTNWQLTASDTPATGAGDLLSPGAVTDNAVIRWDGAGGVTTQNSVVIIGDTGNVTGVGTLSAATTIGVGAATPAASGAGITFPASQSTSSDVNTLDDYEEGTWTPLIHFGGGNGGMTYTTQQGTYTKIGDRICINCYIDLSAKGSATGVVSLASLPFTSQNTAGLNIAWGFFGNTFSSITGHLMMFTPPNTTRADLWFLGTGTATQLLDTHCTATSGFMGSTTYKGA